MPDTYANDTPASLVTMTTKKLLFIILCGVVAGLITWGLTALLDAYVYKAILCNAETAAQCTSSHRYATTTATIIGAAAGLFGLVRLHVYRPLLIVIASYVSLWGLLLLVQPMAWYWAMLITAGLYGVAFGFFSWFARVKRFYIALAVIVVAVIAIRLILNS